MMNWLGARDVLDSNNVKFHTLDVWREHVFQQLQKSVGATDTPVDQ